MLSKNNGFLNKLNEWKFVNLAVLLLFIITGLTYVSNTWSPSSYGHVLVNILGDVDSGPDFGQSRPIRSDEWAVVTPLTQATINNNFERINHTSLYDEDLRINFGLPIKDWGLIFKPTMWMYGISNPAYAYSIHWFTLTVLFIFGYAWLFRWLGATPVIGFTLAAGLYFTGFVQFWWNEKGPIFALFPWVILPFATRFSLFWKATIFYWAAVTWLLTNFYPPIQISLAFVGFVLILAREPQLFKKRPMVVLSFVSLLAAGTAAMYLWDYLQATSTTIYPGSRIVSGGDVPYRYWISWLLPSVNFDRSYNSIIGANICEIGTVGLYYSLLSICFLDFTRWHNVWRNKFQRREILILGAGFTMMLAWMALPLPSWIGAPLLWNHVQPARMQFAGGVLLVSLLFILVNTLGVRLSFFRLMVFSLVTVIGWWLWKYDLSTSRFEDLLIVFLVLLAYIFLRHHPAKAHTGFALISLLAGILIFGRFNPLQSAWPIFNHLPNQVTKNYDQLAANNKGILAVTGLPGAVANGIGYRSLSHLTAVPQLVFWHKHFPDLPFSEFNLIFNRYSHIIATDTKVPRLIHADAIEVPVSLFQEKD